VEVSSSAFCLVDIEHTSGLVESRRVEQIHVSRGGSGHRRRIWLQGHRGSGCVPGRWISRGSFISPFAASVSCGSLQSFAATGFRRAMDSRRSIPAVAGVARRRRSQIHRGSRVSAVIFMFSRGLCVKRMVEQVYSVSCRYVPVRVCVWVFVPYISV